MNKIAIIQHKFGGSVKVGFSGDGSVSWQDESVAEPTEQQWKDWWDEIREDYFLAEIRKKRDALLQESDWTQMPDSPLAGNVLWLSYRQALRDITEQPDLENIVWPEKPE